MFSKTMYKNPRNKNKYILYIITYVIISVKIPSYSTNLRLKYHRITEEWKNLVYPIIIKKIENPGWYTY